MIFFAFLQGLLLYFIIPEEAAEYKWLIIALTNFLMYSLVLLLQLAIIIMLIV